MSTPMFIELPTAGSGTAPVLGEDLSAFASGTAMADLTPLVTEPTLIESVEWSAQKFSTQAGMLIVALSDGTNRRLIGAYAIDAGSASVFASGSVAVEVVVPPGYKLVAAHNVKDAVSAYTNLDLVPSGGVVRAPGVLYGSALPTAGVFYRGKVFTVFGAAGSPDASYICLKLSDDSYAWGEIGSAP